MYQFVVGASAVVLFSFGVYNGSRSNDEAVTNNHNASENNIEEILSLVKDDKTEKNFNALRNALADAMKFLESNPHAIVWEEIWSNKTPKKSVILNVESILKNGEGYTSTEHLNNILPLASSNASYISNLAGYHINTLIQTGCAKEAYVLHNLFLLLNKTLLLSACNTNSDDCAILLAWMGKWLGYPEPCTKVAEKNQTEAMKKILPNIIQHSFFQHNFSTCLKRGMYQTKIDASRKRMS